MTYEQIQLGIIAIATAITAWSTVATSRNNKEMRKNTEALKAIVENE